MSKDQERITEHMDRFSGLRTIGYVAKVSRTGQINLPAPIRRRWEIHGRKVSISDLGHFALIAPSDSGKLYSISSVGQLDVSAKLRKKWGLNRANAHVEIIDLDNEIALLPEGGLLSRALQTYPNLEDMEAMSLVSEVFMRDDSVFRKIGVISFAKSVLGLPEEV